MDATEIRMRKAETVAFIQAEPWYIALARRPLIPDGAGGYKRGPAVTLPAQELRLITSSNQLPLRQGVDGREVQPNFMLLGQSDSDMLPGDTFSYLAVRYEVVFVYPNTIEARRGEVGYGK